MSETIEELNKNTKYADYKTHTVTSSDTSGVSNFTSCSISYWKDKNRVVMYFEGDFASTGGSINVKNLPSEIRCGFSGWGGLHLLKRTITPKKNDEGTFYSAFLMPPDSNGQMILGTNAPANQPVYWGETLEYYV